MPFSDDQAMGLCRARVQDHIDLCTRQHKDDWLENVHACMPWLLCEAPLFSVLETSAKPMAAFPCTGLLFWMIYTAIVVACRCHLFSFSLRVASLPLSLFLQLDILCIVPRIPWGKKSLYVSRVLCSEGKTVSLHMHASGCDKCVVFGVILRDETLYKTKDQRSHSTAHTQYP